MHYVVTFAGRAEIVTADPSVDAVAALEQHLDSVMEELLNLESDSVSTPDISAQLATGDVEISVIVTADTPDGGFTVGMGAIRCAVHAAAVIPLSGTRKCRRTGRLSTRAHPSGALTRWSHSYFEWDRHWPVPDQSR